MARCAAMVGAVLLCLQSGLAESVVDLSVKPSERPKYLAEAAKMKSLQLSEEEFQWVHVLAEGWASPLEGFMTEEQYLQSSHFEHIVVNGEFVPMPVPIVKSCTLADKEAIDKLEKKEIALTGPDGKIVAILSEAEVYQHMKEERSGRTFGITHGEHPYIKMINDSGDWLVGGKLKVLIDSSTTMAWISSG